MEARGLADGRLVAGAEGVGNVGAHAATATAMQVNSLSGTVPEPRTLVRRRGEARCDLTGAIAPYAGPRSPPGPSRTRRPARRPSGSRRMPGPAGSMRATTKSVSGSWARTMKEGGTSPRAAPGRLPNRASSPRRAQVPLVQPCRAGSAGMRRRHPRNHRVNMEGHAGDLDLLRRADLPWTRSEFEDEQPTIDGRHGRLAGASRSTEADRRHAQVEAAVRQGQGRILVWSRAPSKASRPSRR